MEALAQEFDFWKKLRQLPGLDPRPAPGYGPEVNVAQRLNAEALARQLARGQACADQPILGEWFRVPPCPRRGWGVGTRGSTLGGRPPRRAARQAEARAHTKKFARPAERCFNQGNRLSLGDAKALGRPAPPGCGPARPNHHSPPYASPRWPPKFRHERTDIPWLGI